MNESSQTPQPPSLVYRDYQPGDEKQIVELMSPYWEHINSSDDWTREYLDSPDGPCISRVCEIDGRIIAHYGLIPMQITAVDKDISGGKGEGAIIDERYRKNAPNLSYLPSQDRSIFTQLSRDVWQGGIARDNSIMWGFPSKRALRGHLEAGWDSWVLYRRMLIRPVSITGTARFLAGMAPRWSRAFITCLAPVSLWLLTGNLRPLKGNPDTSAVLVEEFDEGVDRFWQRLTEHHRIISINRTCRHLNWRFAHEPYVKAVLLSEGRLGGYAIGLPEDKQGVRNLRIVDLVIDESLFSSLGQLLGGLLEATESKSDLISINYYYRGCDYSEQLSKEVSKYFIPASRLHPQAAIIRVNPLRDDKETIKNPANWFVSDLFRELF